MKSGLGDRNNDRRVLSRRCAGRVSMKSGLGDRNNPLEKEKYLRQQRRLNEVRSWRPEQSAHQALRQRGVLNVSMKSGLGDRNNPQQVVELATGAVLVSMKSGLGDRNNQERAPAIGVPRDVSMKSGLGDRNNQPGKEIIKSILTLSQ